MKGVVKWVKEAGTVRKRTAYAPPASTHQPPSKVPPALTSFSPIRTGWTQWVHPPDVLNYGRVEYAVRFLGDIQVPQVDHFHPSGRHCKKKLGSGWANLR